MGFLKTLIGKYDKLKDALRDLDRLEVQEDRLVQAAILEEVLQMKGTLYNRRIYDSDFVD